MSTQKADFEGYLREVCFKENPSVLDDYMPDFFDSWLVEQEADSFIKWGNEHAASLLARDTN